MVPDANLNPRPPPKLELMTKWNHQSSFLQKLFEMLHNKPEGMNRNWHGWRAFRRATECTLVVDYATGMIISGSVLCLVLDVFFVSLICTNSLNWSHAFELHSLLC